MSLVRNELTIEGVNVKEVLDAIGFNTVFRWEDKDITMLFNFDRIVPRPQPDPPECPTQDPPGCSIKGWAKHDWWRKWYSDNWGTTPYDGAEPDDIIELTDTKASFKFYTTSAFFEAVQTVANRFSAYRFTFSSWEQINHDEGEARWENGQLIVFVPMYELRLSEDSFVPESLPITDAIKTTAAQLVRSAVDTYSGRPVPLTHEEAEAVVAKVLANSGRSSVKVRYEAEDEGACLCVYAKKRTRPTRYLIGIKRGERAQLL